jgi:hypothetical protein
MKKLTLDLDALQVDSFEPSATDRAPRGTVEGRESDQTWEVWCRQPNEFTQTCDYRCQTNDYSCNGTCSNPTCFGDSCVCWTEPEYC